MATASAVVLMGQDARANVLLKVLNNLKFSPENIKQLSENIHQLILSNAAEKIAKLCLKLLGQK